MTDFQFADLIILGLIAVFIALRLRNTLGKDIGHKPDLTQLRRQLSNENEEKVVDIGAKAAASGADLQEKEEEAALEAIGDPALLAGVTAIRAADPSFSISGFIEGAKAAFEWVIRAYSQGDAEMLQRLLAPPVFNEFKQALDAATQNGTRTETTLVAMLRAEIRAASLEKNIAKVTVSFLSEQIEVTRNAEGEIVDGDASAVHTVEDEWVFQRDVKSRNPNWLIMDT